MASFSSPPPFGHPSSPPPFSASTANSLEKSPPSDPSNPSVPASDAFEEISAFLDHRSANVPLSSANMKMLSRLWNKTDQSLLPEHQQLFLTPRTPLELVDIFSNSYGFDLTISLLEETGLIPSAAASSTSVTTTTSPSLSFQEMMQLFGESARQIQQVNGAIGQLASQQLRTNEKLESLQVQVEELRTQVVKGGNTVLTQLKTNAQRAQITPQGSKIIEVFRAFFGMITNRRTIPAFAWSLLLDGKNVILISVTLVRLLLFTLKGSVSSFFNITLQNKSIFDALSSFFPGSEQLNNVYPSSLIADIKDHTPLNYDKVPPKNSFFIVSKADLDSAINAADANSYSAELKSIITTKFTRSFWHHQKVDKSILTRKRTSSEEESEESESESEESESEEESEKTVSGASGADAASAAISAISNAVSAVSAPAKPKVRGRPRRNAAAAAKRQRK